MRQLNSFLIKVENKFIFILLLVFIAVLIVIPINITKDFFNLSAENPLLKKENNVFVFLTIIIIVPILETLVFQIGLIKITLHFYHNKNVAILISAILFGLSHPYSVLYVIYATIMGVYFSYIYFLSLDKKINPFIILSSVHSLYNLVNFILFYYTTS